MKKIILSLITAALSGTALLHAADPVQPNQPDLCSGAGVATCPRAGMNKETRTKALKPTFPPKRPCSAIRQGIKITTPSAGWSGKGSIRNREQIPYRRNQGSGRISA